MWPELTAQYFLTGSLGIIANQFCFETGCCICHLDMLQAESFKIASSLIKELHTELKENQI